MQETWVPSLGWEDTLEKEMATHSSVLAWRIPWTEEPGGLQSMGSQRSWTRLSEFTFTFTVFPASNQTCLKAHPHPPRLGSFSSTQARSTIPSLHREPLVPRHSPFQHLLPATSAPLPITGARSRPKLVLLRVWSSVHRILSKMKTSGSTLDSKVRTTKKAA